MNTRVGSLVRLCFNGGPGYRAFVGFLPGPVECLIIIRGRVHSVRVYGNWFRSWILIKP